MRFPVIILSIVAALLSSCATDTKTDALVRLVEEWKGRTILMPDSITDLLTREPIVFDADFTILNYVDSLGCTGCKMHLSLWKEFVSRLDSLSDYEIRMVTVVNTTQKEELWAELIRNRYDQPVYIDTTGELDRLNNFPSSSKFRTFLLNRDGKVIVVGDPIMSEQMTGLYLSVLAGSVIYNRSVNSTVSVVQSNNRWLDTIRLGESKKADFTLVNHGRDTVRIKSILPTCECTNVLTSRDFIPPNDSVDVEITKQETRYTGSFENQVLINFHSFDNPVIIQLSGVVAN